MSMRDDNRPQDDRPTGDRPSAPGARQYVKSSRFPPSRKTLATGAVTLAVLLGGGAYLITAQIGDRNGSTVAGDTGALSPVVPAASAQHAATGPAPSTPPSSAAATASPAAKRSPHPAPAKTDSAAVRKEIDAARAAAAKDGHPVQRAPTADPDSVDPGPVSESTEKTAEGAIRITTAKGDLTGQSTQLLAADAGVPVGDGHCTQKLRFSNNAAVKVMPTVLLCWRTSADRSVVTLATSKKGKPSTAISLAVINREWAKLG